MSINKKLGIGLAILIIILVVGVTAYFIIIESTHKLSTTENVAYRTLRLVQAEAAYTGQETEITQSHLKALESFVKRVYPGAQWLKKNYGTLYVNNEDTSDMEVTWISDGTYTATFYIDKRRHS